MKVLHRRINGGDHHGVFENTGDFFESFRIIKIAVPDKSSALKARSSFVLCDFVGNTICEFQEGFTSGVLPGAAEKILEHSGCTELIFLRTGITYDVKSIVGSKIIHTGQVIYKAHCGEKDPGISEKSYIVLPITPISTDKIVALFPNSRYDGSCTKSFLNICLSNKAVSRLIVAMTVPELNPPFLLIKKDRPPNLQDAYRKLGRPFLIKHPKGSRGEKIKVVNCDSQEDFDSLIASVATKYPFLLLESFIENTMLHDGETYQFSQRAYYLYNAGDKKSTALQVRRDFAIRPKSQKDASFETSICHSVDDISMQTEKADVEHVTLLKEPSVSTVLNAFHSLTIFDFVAHLFAHDDEILHILGNHLLSSTYPFELLDLPGSKMATIPDSMIEFLKTNHTNLSESTKEFILELVDLNKETIELLTLMHPEKTEAILNNIKALKKIFQESCTPPAVTS